MDSEPKEVNKMFEKKAFGYGINEDDESESDEDDDKPKRLPNPNRHINSAYYKPCGCS